METHRKRYIGETETYDENILDTVTINELIDRGKRFTFSNIEREEEANDNVQENNTSSLHDNRY